MSHITLVHGLLARAAEHPSSPLYTWLDGGEREGQTLTFEELVRRARAVAAMLLARGLDRGDRALLLYPPGLDFIVGFWGCLFAGVVAVPAYPPEPARLARTMPRLRAIVLDAQPAAILTTRPVESLARIGVAEHAPELLAIPWIASDAVDEAEGAGLVAPLPSPDELAFVQYTSGSTREPRGVLLSHRNVASNVQLILIAGRGSPDTRLVSWLPQYHDMGLITGYLSVAMSGGRGFYMSPLDFLSRPMRWLEAISRHRATVSGAPNFAYDLCARRAGEAREALDLSSWSCAFSGAERVRVETLDRFTSAFAAARFRRGALMPCYGLAEATVGVSWTRTPSPSVLELDAAALQRNEVVPAGDGRRVTVSSVGTTVDPAHLIAIAHPERRTLLAEGRVGEIWLAGDSVAEGYWNRPEESEATFGAHTAGGAGPFLRTGDLGFLHRGELYVTGRMKDLIILRGANHYPTDIEATVEDAHRGVRPGCVAAFATTVDGEEQLAIAMEVRREAEGEPSIADAVRARVASRHDLAVHTLILLRAGALPKTTSGKLQRRASREAWLAGELLDATLATVITLPVEDAPVDTGDLAAALAAAVAAATGTSAPGGARLSELGLDSLRAAQLAARIEREFGATVPVARLLQGPTVLELARELEPLVTLGTVPAASPVGDPSEPGATSEVQRAIHVDHARWPGSVSVSVAARIVGPFDPGGMSRAVVALRARHPILASTFAVPGDGELITVSGGDAGSGFALREVAARDLDMALAAEALRPFELAREAPLRVVLHRLGPAEHVLQLTLHHVAYDAVSVFRLVDDLFALQRGATLPPARDYQTFIDWERRYLGSKRFEKDRAYWHARLAGVDLRLPLPAPRAGAGAGAMRLSSRALPAGLLGGLRVAAARAGATPYVALLAGYATALADRLGRDELLLGTTVSLREDAELAGAVGPAMNFVALRCALAGARAPRAALWVLRDTVAGALEHRAYPFGRLVEELGHAEAPRLGLNANFNFYDVSSESPGSVGGRLRAGGAVALGEARVTGLPIGGVPVVRPYDLTCGVWNGNGAASIQLRVREGLFDASWPDSLLDDYLSRLATLAGG